MKLTLLRMGHRKKRDIRITTHCCLVARAFLADEIILSGEDDPQILKTVKSVAKNWGGKLKVGYEQNWRVFLKRMKKKGEIIIHLTMYGHPILEKLPQILPLSKKQRIVVVVGAEKMPPEIYKLADFNIAITNQPHSEVAALAIFLNELQKGAPLSKNSQKNFKSAKYVIKPVAKGN
ncbi:MAG: tRNA (cytidine(56)-2'-O)-methyltransferase [Candidatus Micrarchaeota archaeon]